MLPPLPPTFPNVLVQQQSAAGAVTGDEPTVDGENSSTGHVSH